MKTENKYRLLEKIIASYEQQTGKSVKKEQLSNSKLFQSLPHKDNDYREIMSKFYNFNSMRYKLLAELNLLEEVGYFDYVSPTNLSVSNSNLNWKSELVLSLHDDFDKLDSLITDLKNFLDYHNSERFKNDKVNMNIATDILDDAEKLLNYLDKTIKEQLFKCAREQFYKETLRSNHS